MKTELIIALDVTSASVIPAIVKSLPNELQYYKVGLELFTHEGPQALTFLKANNRKIFLDLKLHDIPNTVAQAVKAAAGHKVSLMTLHASGGKAMLKAAAEAARESGPDAPRLLAVTVLTSMNEQDLSDMGIQRSMKEHVLSLGEMAVNAGIDGVVCSPLEAAAFRQRLGPDALIVTPGIRPAGSGLNDQKRSATPRDAVLAGASHIVVGRPILAAPDPAESARQVLSEIQSAYM
jgi:orotidine-5'-phosphate decarboxylase